MSGLVITDLIQFLYSRFTPGYRCAYHLHHFFQMDVILEGELKFSLEGRKPIQGRAGDAWLIPPLMRHAYETNAGYRIGIFKFHVMPRYLPALRAGFARFQAAPWLHGQIEAAGHRKRKDLTLAMLQASAILTLGLMNVLKTNPVSVGPTVGLDAFRRQLWGLLERITQESHAPWTVTQMASECHLSINRFTKRFRGLIGMTPNRYLLETRIRSAASDLLSDPPMSIKEVAEKSNYSTVHAFTRAFKTVIGTSPGAYQRSSEVL